VKRFIPTLLRMALSFAPVGAAYSADTLDHTTEVTAVLASDRVAMPNTSEHAAASATTQETLNLRPPELQSVEIRNLQPDATVADSDEAEAVTLAVAPFVPEERRDTLPPPSGIASLYWAARHPTQAWRVFVPIQLDEHAADTESRGRAAERATPETLTEQREISVTPSPTTLAPGTGGKCACRRQPGEAT
jgi:hypothetical protein